MGSGSRDLYRVRVADGFSALADEPTIKRWIAEDLLDPHDEIGWGDGPLVPLASIRELARYFPPAPVELAPDDPPIEWPVEPPSRPTLTSHPLSKRRRIGALVAAALALAVCIASGFALARRVAADHHARAQRSSAAETTSPAGRRPESLR